MPYGKEIVLDLHGCDPSTFTRAALTDYFRQLCDLIDMEACDLHFWDDVGVAPEDRQTEPHTTGTSAIQFILTSNITVHTLDLLQAVYVNLFSCKDFDPAVVRDFTLKTFGGRVVQERIFDRI